jgi:hypothetical protein
VPFAGRPIERDVSPGAWLADGVAGARDGTLAALLPPVFEAYARVLHPAYRFEELDDVEVRWATVAADNGRSAHPHMQWAAVTGSWDYVAEADQPGLWNDSPAEGHLPSDVALRVAAVLIRHTGTPADCWFGVWAGFGFIDTEAPQLAVGGRAFWLVRGPVEFAAANMADEPAEQSAGLWWPADRAWCVVTDVDLMSTYVGGSAAAIADLLAADGLEALPAAPDDPVRPDSDSVNPPPN